MEEVREGGRKRTVREEFETLTTVARKSGTGRERREREATGNRKRPGVQSKNPFSF